MKKIRTTAILLLAVITLTALVSCGCNHKYTDGTCSKCGKTDPDYNPPCSHLFEEGFCSKCGAKNPGYIAPCNHNYVNGACSICGEECDHNYIEGVCSVCGIEDPHYIPADGGQSLYKDIVEKFKYLILYKYMNEELPQKADNEPFYVDALYEVAGEYNPSLEMGYAFKDIDADGYSELLLMGRESRIYAMFTILNKEPALVSTFQQGMGYIDPYGTVFYIVKDYEDGTVQVGLGTHITKLVNGKLVGIEYGWVDVDHDIGTDDDTIYYYISEDGVKTGLTDNEYKAYGSLYKYYWEYPTRLTRLNGFRYNSALLDSANPTTKADFSTYDAIIKTFGEMHSDVAEGKYVRSDWTKGTYDSKMIFESDEDFVIYNKLIAACVLVQNSSTAVFGYARNDLNKDGVEELILLDNKFHVFAIFTLSNGKPVLIDSYTDLRTAFIDENGDIHVMQRVVPGNKDDYEYFVYEAGMSGLVCKTAIGIKCDANGNQEKIYKIVNGVVVDIEQSEWDALYAEYLSDIGTDEFHTYTKNESGLTFVAVS